MYNSKHLLTVIMLLFCFTVVPKEEKVVNKSEHSVTIQVMGFSRLATFGVVTAVTLCAFYYYQWLNRSTIPASSPILSLPAETVTVTQPTKELTNGLYALAPVATWKMPRGRATFCAGVAAMGVVYMYKKWTKQYDDTRGSREDISNTTVNILPTIDGDGDSVFDRDYLDIDLPTIVINVVGKIELIIKFDSDIKEASWTVDNYVSCILEDATIYVRLKEDVNNIEGFDKNTSVGQVNLTLPVNKRMFLNASEGAKVICHESIGSESFPASITMRSGAEGEFKNLDCASLTAVSSNIWASTAGHLKFVSSQNKSIVVVGTADSVEDLIALDGSRIIFHNEPGIGGEMRDNQSGIEVNKPKKTLDFPNASFFNRWAEYAICDILN